jgi:hAT family C-terminal dimerisation region
MENENESSSFLSGELFTARTESIASSIVTEATSVKSRNRAGRCNAYIRGPVGDEPARDEKQRKILYCTLCEPGPGSYGTAISSNLAVHLKSRHEIDVQSTAPTTRTEAAAQLARLWHQSKGTHSAQSHSADVLRSVIDDEVVTQALVTMVAAHSLPFRIVEWPEFHAFCGSLNPEAKISISRSVITRTLGDMYLSQKDIVRCRLQSAISNIHLTVDVWASPNGYLILAVCCYFITKEGERFKSLLALRDLGRHTGEEQWAVLLQVLEEYGITHRIGTITGDNASTNDTLCRAASRYLKKQHEIQWDPLEQRIRCQGHTINLIAKAFLFTKDQQDSIEANMKQEEDEDTKESEANSTTETVGASDKEEREASTKQAYRSMGLLGRLHNVVVHTRSSAGRMQQFRSLAGRMIPLDNNTRWNSWYQMLKIALDVEPQVDSYIKANFNELKKDVLAPQDWRHLQAVCNILEPFYQATMDTQGDKATIEQTLFSLDTLNEHLKRCLARYNNSPEICSRVNRAIKKLKEYYIKLGQSKLYYAAVVFHPSFRTKYITSTRRKESRALLQKVEELWITHRDLVATLPVPVAYEVPEAPTAKSDNTYYDIKRELLERAVRPKSQDEYREYCSEPPLEIDITPIAWWSSKTQRKRFPRLSVLAVNTLAIPAMSDEPERVFSGGRRTVSWERMKLGVSSLERLECMKVWHHSGILRERAGHADGAGRD